MKSPLKSSLFYVFGSGLCLGLLAVNLFVHLSLHTSLVIGIVGVILLTLAVKRYRTFVREFDRVLTPTNDKW